MKTSKCFKSILILFLALALFSFSACQPTVDPGPPEDTVPVFVVNSAWEVVLESEIKGSSRTLDSTAAIEEQIAEYNATHTDDQWFLLEGEVPAIEEAPDAPLAVVYADNYQVYFDITVPREELAETRELARTDAKVLMNTSGRPVAIYVDNDAPSEIIEPPPVDNRPPYEKYALYLLDKDGAIVHEEHPPEGQALLDYFMGDATKTEEDWYKQMLPIFNLQCEVWNGTQEPGYPFTVWYGSLYPPEES